MGGRRRILQAKKADIKEYVDNMKAPTFKFEPKGRWIECAGGASSAAGAFSIQTQVTSEEPPKYRLRVLYGDLSVALPALELQANADGGPPTNEEVLNVLRKACGLDALETQ